MDLKHIISRINHKKIVSFSLSALLTVALFLLLPLMYLISKKQSRSLMMEPRSSNMQREVVLHKKKKKAIKRKKLKKIKKINPAKKNNRINRFKLDLSMAMGSGDGALVRGGQGMIYRVNQVDTPPVQRYSFAPTYPEEARRAGIQTTVVVDLMIDEKGKVRNVIIKRCMRNWGFEEAVRKAMMQWEFAPARLNNIPVKVWATISIDFKI